ncbi:MAG TPA: hypothetical protein VGH27_30140 [Streptosporangiaceae bacterium]|jgi:hypothetical protein
MNNSAVPAPPAGGDGRAGRSAPPLRPGVTAAADPGEFPDDDPPDEAGGDEFEPL